MHGFADARDAAAAEAAIEASPVEPKPLDLFLTGPLFFDIVFTGLRSEPQPGTEAMAGLSRTVNAMAALLNTVSLESFAFPLPGNLKIDAAHGRLAFNRLTGDWEAGFGAKLRFPDTGFTLDVRSATLAKNGNFSLSLGTGGSVPLEAAQKSLIR